MPFRRWKMRCPGQRNCRPYRRMSILVDDFEAHLAGGTGNNAEGSFVVTRVQIVLLRSYDVHDLFARDLADLVFVRFFRAGGDVGRLLQQDRGGRAFSDESERFVFENRDHDRENVAGLFLGGSVKFLAERHDVHATRSERGADRWRRVRLARWNLQFDVSYNFFCHNYEVLNVKS